MSSSVALSEVFTLRMTDLQSSVNKDGQSLALSGYISWSAMFSDKSGNDGKVLNGFDPAEFVTAFNRDDLNKAYIKIVQPSGGIIFTDNAYSMNTSYRDAQVCKVQIDLLAGFERDLRMRYRSKVRMLAHGTARLQSHGMSIGPINKGIVNFVKLLMFKKDAPTE